MNKYKVILDFDLSPTEIEATNYYIDDRGALIFSNKTDNLNLHGQLTYEAIATFAPGKWTCVRKSKVSE